MLVQHEGERRKLSLKTPIKAAAAARARDNYLSIITNGWGETLKTLRPDSERPPVQTELTIGRFLSELKSKADLQPKTLEGYAIAFRGIVADIFGIDSGKEKYDYRGGGRARWIEKINAIRLDAVTPELVQVWKRTFIARAGSEDPIKVRSAKSSVNSYMRRAKCLFAPRAIRHLSVVLPSPLPFAGVAFESRANTRYHSNIDPGKLIRAAQKELADADESVFLAFLLGLSAGLRRLEIDRLEWSAFHWNNNVIKIRRTKYFEPKTETSIREVLIDPEVMSVFRGYAARATSNFVIDGLSLGKTMADGYRAKDVFDRLSSWLKQHGVTARKPVHELRKEFGSMVNRLHGLSAARDLLGHSDVGVTAAYYVDRPRGATSGLGSLLATKRKGRKIVEFTQPAAKPRQKNLKS
jgi:integrase